MYSPETQSSLGAISLKLKIEQQLKPDNIPVKKPDYAEEILSSFQKYFIPPGFQIISIDSKSAAPTLFVKIMEASASHEYTYSIAAPVRDFHEDKRIGGTQISCDVKLFSLENDLIFQTNFSVGFKPVFDSDTKTDPEIKLYNDAIFRFRIIYMNSFLPEVVMIVLKRKPVSFFLEKHLIGDIRFSAPDESLSVVDNLPLDIQKEAIPTLINLLGKRQVLQYEKHILSIIERIGKIDLETLRPSLENQDPLICAQAIRVLGRIGSSAFELVNSSLENKHKEPRLAAIEALKEIGTSDSIFRIREVGLNDEDSDVRRMAVKVLAEDGPRGFKELIYLIQAGDVDLVGIIHGTLNNLVSLPDYAKGVFKNAIRERREPEIIASIISIGPNTQEDIPYLLEQLRNESNEVRMLAARNLGSIGKSQQVIGDLEAARNMEENEQVRSTMDRAIQIIQSRLRR